MSEAVKERRGATKWSQSHGGRRSRPIPRSSSSLLSFYFLLPSCLPSPRGAETQRGLRNGFSDRSRLLRYHLIPLCSPPICAASRKNTLYMRPHTCATPTVPVFHPAVQCSGRLCTSVDGSDNSIQTDKPSEPNLRGACSVWMRPRLCFYVCLQSVCGF